MAEATAENAAAKPRKGLPKTLLIVGVVSVLEAGLIIGLMKMFAAGPAATHGAEGPSLVEGPEPEVHPTVVEVELLTKFRAPNTQQGATWLYDLDLVVKVDGKRKDDMEKVKAEHGGAIADAVANIVRSLEPRYLNEPDLRTLRFQIHRALGEIARDPDLVKGVLIPRCVPLRAG